MAKPDKKVCVIEELKSTILHIYLKRNPNATAAQFARYLKKDV